MCLGAVATTSALARCGRERCNNSHRSNVCVAMRSIANKYSATACVATMTAESNPQSAASSAAGGGSPSLPTESVDPAGQVLSPRLCALCFGHANPLVKHIDSGRRICTLLATIIPSRQWTKTPNVPTHKFFGVIRGRQRCPCNTIDDADFVGHQTHTLAYATRGESIPQENTSTHGWLLFAQHILRWGRLANGATP